jgi:hypothetical protein
MLAENSTRCSLNLRNDARDTQNFENLKNKQAPTENYPPAPAR